MTSLFFIPGSLRADSSSRRIAAALADRVPPDVTCTTADIGTLPHYNADIVGHPEVLAFIAAIAAADALVFVTPEYNYSVPGVLKNAIDWASRPAFGSAFKGKPCLVITVSGGPTGGVRAQAHLKYVLSGLLARLHVDKEIIVPFANAKIVDGVFDDAEVLAFAGAQITALLDGL
ncbi:MAG: NAD(P)H-dependent oxidoreductase [Jannaschia sp.]